MTNLSILDNHNPISAAAMTEEKFLEVAYNSDIHHAVMVAKIFSVPAAVIKAWVAAVITS